MSGYTQCRAASWQMWARVLPLLCVAGCSLTQTLDTYGPTSLASADYQLPPLPQPGQPVVSPHPGPVGNFELAYARADADAVKVNAGIADESVLGSNDLQCANTNGSCSKYSIHSRQMAVAGVALADQNCKSFFDSLGRVQQYVLFSRDVLSNAGAIAGGVVGLVSGAAAAPASVGFAIATADTGLDIYTRNFLFGADNIDSVMSLIVNAENTHTNTVLPEADTSAWSFEQAQQVITDHQDLCMPSHILLLTRSAIANKSLTPFDPQGNPIPSSQAAAGAAGGTPPAAAPAGAGANAGKARATLTPNNAGAATMAILQSGRPASRHVIIRAVPGG